VRVAKSKNRQKELPMSIRNPLARRAALAVTVWIAVTAFAPGTARADERARWCADMGDLGTGLECHYFTLEQCLARASGNTNICSVNPWYIPERTPGRRQRHNPSRYR
jgi:hypothetical protein